MAIKKVIVRPNLGKYIENLSILYLAKGLFITIFLDLIAFCFVVMSSTHIFRSNYDRK